MHRLVCQPTSPRHLYKKSGHLVRTPIGKTLNLAPDEAAMFDCGYDFKQDIPITGFYSGTVHYTEIPKVGKELRRAYLNQTTRKGPYIWRSNMAFPNFDPGFIFYQGSYSTSKLGWGFPEAYMCIPAYHFTIPQEYSDLTVTSATLLVTHGGTILKHGSAMSWQSDPSAYPYFAANAPNYLIGAGTGWRDPWTQNLGVFASLNQEPRQMYANCQQSVQLATNHVQGTLNNRNKENAELYWISWPSGAVSYSDGTINITTDPWIQYISLAANTVAAIDSLRGGWVTTIPAVSVSSNPNVDTAQDYPCWANGSDSRNAGYWLSCTFWGFRLVLTLEID